MQCFTMFSNLLFKYQAVKKMIYAAHPIQSSIDIDANKMLIDKLVYKSTLICIDRRSFLNAG